MSPLLKLLALVLAAISPQLKELLCKAVVEWDAKTHETPNPWDDVVVDFLRALLGI